MVYARLWCLFSCLSAVFVLGSGQLCAQFTFVLKSLDVSNYPVISAKVVAVDEFGQIVSIKPEDIKIIEGGIERSIIDFRCPTFQELKGLSSVLTLDVSYSMISPMSLGTRLQVAAAVGRTWLTMQNFAVSECAITQFYEKNRLLRTFSSDATWLASALDSLPLLSGTDLNQAFIEPPAGSLLVVPHGKNAKAVVVLTDGASQVAIRADEIIRAAKMNDCPVYVVMIGADLERNMKRICLETGGLYFDDIQTHQEAERAFKEIYATSAPTEPCEISWKTDQPCKTGPVDVVIDWNGYRSTKQYSTAKEFVQELKPSSQQVPFGSLPPGVYDDLITVTAVGGDFTVTNIVSSNPRFSASPRNFSLRKGSTETIDIRYDALDDSYTFGDLTFETTSCPLTISVSGGSLKPGSSSPTLKIVRPNGGERFVAGLDTVITWKGIPAADNVIVSLSTDNGRTWRVLADSARNLSMPWKNIPLPASATCLIRLTQVQPQRTDDSDIKLKGHSGNVMAVDWGPSNGMVATAGSDTTGRVFKVDQASERATFIDHKNGLTSVDYSTLKGMIASGSKDGRICIWNEKTTQTQSILIGHTAIVTDVAFSYDAKKILSTSEDQQARIWDPVTGSVMNILTGHTGSIVAGAWSSSNVNVVTISSDKSLKVWDVLSGTSLRTQFLPAAPLCVDWSANSAYHAVGFADNSAAIYRSTDGTSQQLLVGHARTVNAIEFSPNNQFVLTGSSDSTLRIWSVSTGKVTKTFRAPAVINDVAWNSGSDSVAAACSDGIVRVWAINPTFIQSDVSDKVFSIVAPSATAVDVDMGKAVIATARDSAVTAFITNTSSLPLKVDSIIVTGINATAFSVVAGSQSFIVEPNNSQVVEFRFMPATLGMKTAIIEVYSGAGKIQKTIRGEGIGDIVSIVTAIVDFDSVEVFQSKDTVDVPTIRNIGNEPLVVTAVKFVPARGSYSAVGIPTTFTLQPSQTAKHSIRFRPEYEGFIGGDIEYHYNGIGSPAVVSLTGKGFMKYSRIQADTPSFEDVTCGRAFVTDTVHITNNGALNLVVSEANIVGPHAPDFEVLPAFNQMIVSPGSTKPIAIRFMPTADGVRTASVELKSNAQHDTVIAVPLSGQRIRTDYSVSVTAVDLGVIAPDATTYATFVLSNDGSVANVYTVSSSSSMFTVQSRIALEAGASKVVPVNVTGTPTEGTYTAIITVMDSICAISNTVSATVTVSSGSITGPGIAAAVAELEPVMCNDTIYRDVTIRNVGTETLVISSAEFAGIHPEDYGFAVPFTEQRVEPGKLLVLRIRLVHKGTGERSASLTIKSNAGKDSLLVVALTSVHLQSGFDIPLRIEVGELCPMESFTRNVTALNIGSTRNTLEVFRVTGILIPSNQQLTLDSGSTGSLSIRGVTPLEFGPFADTLILVDRICNTTYSVIFAGTVHNTGLEVSDVHMVAIDGGSVVEYPVTIRNTSASDIVVQSASDIAPFVYKNLTVPIIIPAQDSVVVYVQYTPATSSSQAVMATFATLECAVSAGATIDVDVRKRGAVLRIGSVGGNTGQPVSIPITIQNASLAAAAGTSHVSATLVYNATLLEPTPSLGMGVISNGQRRIDMEFDLPQSDGIVTYMPFIGLLGDDSITTVDLIELRVNGNGAITVEPGVFTLLDLCRAGGTRLIDASENIVLSSVAPNPVSSQSFVVSMRLIENGPSSVSVFNSIGAKVETIAVPANTIGEYKIVVPIGNLSTGTYYVVLSTPTVSESIRVEVIR